MSEPYTKLSSNIIFSSMWQEDAETCKVWVTLLALKDRNGIVRQNILGMSALIGIPVEKIEAALELFQRPDPRSTTPDFEGRRIEKCDDGYRLLNYEKYQQLGWSDDKKEYERQRKRAYRSKEKSTAPTPAPKPVRESFQRPTIEAVQLHAAKIGLPPTEAEKFFSYYESNGWRVGRNPMKNWQRAMVTWKFNSNNYANPKPNPQQRVDRSIGTCNEGTAHLYEGLGRVAKT